MSLFKRRPKVDIQIIKTESLKKAKDAEDTVDDETTSASGVVINILGKQQLREELSTEELQDVAEQIAQEAEEIVQAILPDIVRKAQQARKDLQIDEAILMLWQHARRLGTSPEIEEELQNCLDVLADDTQLQGVTNTQLAKVFFDAAGFSIQKDEMSFQDSDLLASRLTCIYIGEGQLQQKLDVLAGLPRRYFTYCLKRPAQSLSLAVLGIVSKDFEEQASTANNRIHFTVCKDSDSMTNMHINVRRFADNITTIPLERDEMRWAVLNNKTKSYLESKVTAWTADLGLFGTTRPVSIAGEFFGRRSYFERIAGAVNKRQSFYLLGVRNIGKTSLIENLNNLGAFRDHLYAYLRAESYLDRPNFDGAVKSVLEQWFEALARKYPNVAKSIQPLIPKNATAFERLSAFLEEIDSVNHKKQMNIRCLFILDDVNMLLRNQGGGQSMWERGANQLVNLLSYRQGLVTTGLTLWNFETLAAVEKVYGGLGIRIYLKPLSHDECDMMINFIGGIINMEFEEESLEAIYEQTGGHPLWTRSLCDIISHTRDSVREKLTVTKEHIEQAVSDFLVTSRNFIDQSYLSLGVAEKGALNEFKRSSGLVEVAGLPKQSQDAFIRLKTCGLVEEDSDQPGCYRLCMGLLARYL